MIGENIDKLSDSEAENLEGEIKYTELFQVLKFMKNEKKKKPRTRWIYYRLFFLIFLGWHRILYSEISKLCL